jgi:hypothetical protein
MNYDIRINLIHRYSDLNSQCVRFIGALTRQAGRFTVVLISCEDRGKS